VLVIVQGILQRAVEWGYIPTNPAKVIRKPAGRRRHVVRPMAPVIVERIRAHLLASGDLRSATLVSVLAYAGVRPGEALALTFGDVRERTILIERAASLGEVKETKTGRLRSVRLLPPLAEDLSPWRTASGAPSDETLVFPSPSSGLWTRHDWKNWARRRFRPAATAADVEGARPYDLRHSFCSLLLYEGRTIVEVARQAGHAPSMSLDTYQHVIDELEGTERVPADAQIRRARASLVPASYPPNSAREPSDAAKEPNALQITASRRPDSNRGPLHYEDPLGPAMSVATTEIQRTRSRAFVSVRMPRCSLLTRNSPSRRSTTQIAVGPAASPFRCGAVASGVPSSQAGARRTFGRRSACVSSAGLRRQESCDCDA
jgi:site-specific recombinase XerD